MSESTELSELLARMAAGKAEMSRLMLFLSTAAEYDIIGVVGPSGGGACSTEDDNWRFSFTLHAWRIADGPLRRDELPVRQNITSAGSRLLFDALPAYAIVRLRVRMAEYPGFEGLQAALIGMPKPFSGDSELIDIAEELQAPVIRETDRFGAFTLNRRFEWYEANCHWGESPTELTLVCETGQSFPEGSLAVAMRLWDDMARWDEAVRERMLGELLPLKNEIWLEDDEKALTGNDFHSAAELTSITVKANGGFEFWFDDGDMFGGHSIVVRGSIDEGVKHAGIEG